jgi:hypothetical protein
MNGLSRASNLPHTVDRVLRHRQGQILRFAPQLPLFKQMHGGREALDDRDGFSTITMAAKTHNRHAD